MIDMEPLRRTFAMFFYKRAVELTGKELEYFLPPFTIYDLTDCIFMEAIKKLFEETMPKSSLRSHLKRNGLLVKVELNDPELDDERLGVAKINASDRNAANKMRFLRILEYAQYYRTAQSDIIVSEGGIAPAELRPDDMSSISNMFAGHKLTDMQFFELSTIDRLPLLKAIAKRRISSIKKLPRDDLKFLLDEYAEFVNELKATATADERKYVFNTFALYTLEWKFCVDFAYAAICESENIRGSNPFDAAELLVGRQLLYTRTRDISTDNRFIFHRKELIPQALQAASREEVRKKIYAYLRIKDEAMFGMNGQRPIVDFLREVTKLEDWAKFIKCHYPLVESRMTYDWTKKRLLSYRKLMEQLIEDIPAPKSPPKKKKSPSQTQNR